MNANQHNSSELRAFISDGVAHAHRMLESQIPSVQMENLDLLPEVFEIARDIYLAGVLWRFNEQIELPTSARDRGFAILMAYFAENGMTDTAARERIAMLDHASRTADGKDGFQILSGYNAIEGDGTLAECLKTLARNPATAGKPIRTFRLFHSIAWITGISSFAVSLFLGIDLFRSLGICIAFGGAVFATGVAVYNYQIK